MLYQKLLKGNQFWLISSTEKIRFMQKVLKSIGFKTAKKRKEKKCVTLSFNYFKFTP